jgi:aminopeptidase N
MVALLLAYKDETVESVWDIIAVTIGELKKFVEDDDASESALRKLARILASPQYQRLGWQPTADESEADTKLRSTILGLMSYSEDIDVITHAKKIYDSTDISKLDPELRSLILAIVVRHSENETITDKLIALYSSTSSAELQRDICAGLCSTKNTNVINRLLGNLTDPETVRSQDVAHWFVFLIRNRYGRLPAWRWMKTNWSWIEQVFGGDKSFDDYPRYSASGMVNQELLEDYITFFAPLKDRPALSRVISIGISEIKGRVELIEHDKAAVRKCLLDL